MNNIKVIVQSVMVISVGGLGLLLVPQAIPADSHSEVPAVVDDGFGAWEKKGAIYAVDAWQKGGLMEGDRKVEALSNYFRRMDRAVGRYKSYEVIETKRISQNSQIVYLSVNFERAAIYARFLLYRTDKDWVVQNMDFSPKPEVIMPWLAFQGVNYAE